MIQKKGAQMVRSLLGGLALAAMHVGALAQGAPVKCTSANGAVSYVQGECPAGSKTQAVPGAQTSVAPGGSWTFSKGGDSMTGEVSCVASSPAFDVPTKRGWHSIQLAVVALREGEAVVLRARGSDVIFHHAFSGTGLQVDSAPMNAFDARPSQQSLILSTGHSAEVVSAMLVGSTARARVRFWPWDEAADSARVSLAGFKQALALARNCRGR